MRRERGFVLIYTAVMGLLIMTVWALALRATRDSVAVERFHLEQEARHHSVTRAAAAALLLLETGTPPGSPYECIVTTSEGGKTYDCKLTFANVLLERWSVEAELASEAEVASLPVIPESF